MKYLQESHFVRYSDGDRYGRLKLRSLFDYAQDAAGKHAELLGVGFEELRQRNQVWVLSRIGLKMQRYPEICEPFALTTYPMGFERFFARREFRFVDGNGKPLGQASSYWLLLELDSMRILDPHKELTDKMPDNSDMSLAFESLGKIRPETPELHLCQIIQEAQIDMNGHLNNAEYAALIHNFLGAGKYPSYLQINYQNGVPVNSQVELSGTITADNFSIQGETDKKIAFQAEGKLLSEA